MCAAQAEPVVDYLTRYSGLHPGDLDPSVSRHHITTMKAAYLQLRQLVDAGCRFVGHGLQKDFEMINVVVPPDQIIDTVAPHAHASRARAPRHSTPPNRPGGLPWGPWCACACTSYPGAALLGGSSQGPRRRPGQQPPRCALRERPPSHGAIAQVDLFYLPGSRRISLRFLAWHLLGQQMSNRLQDTHDSIEDARTALQEST